MWWRVNVVAFLNKVNPLQRILLHIGEPTTPPRIAPARQLVRLTQAGGPPAWLEADFDQTVSW